MSFTGSIDTQVRNNPTPTFDDRINNYYDILGGNTLDPVFDQQRRQIFGSGLGVLGMLGLDRDALTQNAGIDKALNNLAYGDLDIGRRGANRDLGTVAELLGLNKETLANQLAGIALSERRQNQAWSDDATARGAFTAPGTRREFSAIEKEAQLARQASRIGFDEARANLQNRAGNARDALAKIDNDAKRIGLNAQQIDATLNQGLARLGLEEFTSTQDLYNRLTSTDIEQQTMALNLLNQAWQIASQESAANTPTSTLDQDIIDILIGGGGSTSGGSGSSSSGSSGGGGLTDTKGTGPGGMVVPSFINDLFGW